MRCECKYSMLLGTSKILQQCSNDANCIVKAPLPADANWLDVKNKHSITNYSYICSGHYSIMLKPYPNYGYKLVAVIGLCPWKYFDEV